MAILSWLLLPLATLLGAALGESYSGIAVVFVLLVLPLGDHFAGTDAKATLPRWMHYFFRVPWVIFPLSFQYLLLLYGCNQFARNDLGVLGGFLAILAMSFAMGLSFYAVAHELIHRKSPWERFCGFVMLVPFGYTHHMIEHLHGHHHYAATSRDPATAPYRSHIYAFLSKAIVGVFKKARRKETLRLQKLAVKPRFYHDRIISGAVASGLFLMAAVYGLGSAALVFLVGNALLTILWIEALNYVQHYGLTRRAKSSTTRAEEFTPLHAWDSDHVWSNQVLLFQARHTHHHLEPELPLNVLVSNPRSIKLPFGYITMMFLAFLPWAWYYIMDPLAQRVQRGMKIQEEDLQEEAKSVKSRDSMAL